MKKLGLGDSYTSLILGIIVVVIVGVLVITFIRRQGVAPRQPSLTPAEVEQAQVEKGKEVALPTKHTAAQGENLWVISEKYYKSGYNWVDLAKTNNLKNPDVLVVGAELEIPNVESRTPTQAGILEAIKGDSYTVVMGDNLWEIAVRAYGDGFKWVEVAKANNLVNPDLIHAGNTLKLPR